VRVTVVDDVLVAICALVNGGTIARQPAERTVEYWHVELERHDVILAEGLPVESYLDCGNRGWFGEVAGDLRPELPDPEQDADRRVHPLVTQGAVAAAARERLASRMPGLGWTLTDDTDLHLVVDGTRLAADLDEDLARFVFPASAREVCLMSEVFIPAATGLGLDDRELGACLGALHVSDGLRYARDIPLDAPGLTRGLHEPETHDGRLWRWTNGAMPLPPAFWQGCRSWVILRVGFHAQNARRWIAPGFAACSLGAAEPAPGKLIQLSDRAASRGPLVAGQLARPNRPEWRMSAGEGPSYWRRCFDST
jgi:hypothetical protein